MFQRKPVDLDPLQESTEQVLVHTMVPRLSPSLAN